jgi:cytidylate kinase
VTLDGVDVSHLIWSESVNDVLPWVSNDIRSREAILEFHRRETDGRAYIVAGRDVGRTLILDANPKIFLWARFAVRRERRRHQVEQGGWGTPVVGASSEDDLASAELLAHSQEGLSIDTSALSITDVREVVAAELAAKDVVQ